MSPKHRRAYENLKYNTITLFDCACNRHSALKLIFFEISEIDCAQTDFCFRARNVIKILQTSYYLKFPLD